MVRSDEQGAHGAPKILFVCLGNICRSPAAQGVFLQKTQALGLDVEVDSAGTGGWHRGDPPDSRMVAAASRRGIDLSGQRARQVDTGDFYVYDLILPMDDRNHTDLVDLAPRDGIARVRKFLSFASGSQKGGDVPDPYYGGAAGFDTVLDLLDEASDGLIRYLMERRRDA